MLFLHTPSLSFSLSLSLSLSVCRSHTARAGGGVGGVERSLAHEVLCGGVCYAYSRERDTHDLVIGHIAQMNESYGLIHHSFITHPSFVHHISRERDTQMHESCHTDE